jgi:hypothetical protein
MTERKLFTCSCAGECGGITVEGAGEWAEKGAVEISFWQRGYVRFPRISRLRWAWKMLVYGEIHGDQVVLDKQTAEKVAEAIRREAERDE